MTTPSGRSAVRDDLLADLDAVTAQILSAVRAEIPAYESLATTQLDEVGRIAAWGTARVLDAWVADARLDEQDLQRFRGIGAARALDGRPLPVVLRAYRVAGSTVTDLVAQLAAGRLDVDDAIALARLWMATIDELSEALYAGHAQVSARLEGDHARALVELTDDLLVGRHATSAAVTARAGRLGLTLPRRALLLHAVPSPAPGRPATDWDDLLDLLVPNPTARLARHRDATGTVLLPETQQAALPALLRDAGWRGVALVRPVDSLARASRLALHALEGAPSYAWQERPLLDEVDVLAIAQATGHVDAEPSTLVALVRGPLQPHPHLREGLEALLATGSVAAAAAASGTHAQTMHHRVRRLVTLIGRDPRTPWDRFVLQLACLLDR